jgi:hypothetical protein
MHPAKTAAQLIFFPIDRWLSRPLSGEFFEGPSKLFGVDRAGIERLAGPL